MASTQNNICHIIIITVRGLYSFVYNILNIDELSFRWMSVKLDYFKCIFLDFSMFVYIHVTKR